MKLYRFDTEVGENINLHNSTGFVISKIARVFEDAMINCVYLDAHGVIGYHQAAAPQLFLVVQGAGWVRGAEIERTSIKAGQAAYWEQGEWHASGTETGLMAIIIEGVKFDLSRLRVLD